MGIAFKEVVYDFKKISSFNWIIQLFLDILSLEHETSFCRYSSLQVEEYIANTVQSVLKQTYQNFELLIIDDGSPDQSIKVCQQFTNPKIKIIHQENRDYLALETPVFAMPRRIYSILDGDDLAARKAGKTCCSSGKSANCGVSFSRSSSFIDELGNHLGIYQMPKLGDHSASDPLPQSNQ